MWAGDAIGLEHRCEVTADTSQQRLQSAYYPQAYTQHLSTSSTLYEVPL